LTNELNEYLGNPDEQQKITQDNFDQTIQFPATTNDLFLDPSLSIENMDIYIVRKSILNALTANISSFRGSLLDIGCGEMPYKQYILSHSKVEKYIGLDIENPTYQQNSKPDLFWDGEHVPLEDNSADCVMATEFFEHVPYPQKIMAEIYRILKPNGTIFITVPFIWPLHTMPYDEYRYTPFSLERIIRNSGFHEVDIKALGGWDASFAQVMGLWMRRRPMTERMRKTHAEALFPLYKSLIESDQIPTHFNESMLITGLTATAKKKVQTNDYFLKLDKYPMSRKNFNKDNTKFGTINNTVLAIVCPQVGAPSETFIRKHINLISPGKTVVLTGSILDHEWFDGPIKIIPTQIGEYTFDKKIEEDVLQFLKENAVTHILFEFGCIGGAVLELNHRTLKLPAYVHFHGQDSSEFLRNPEIVKYYQWMANVVKGVIAVSKPMMERLANIGIPKNKICLIHSGVDINQNIFSHPEKEPCRLISVSRLVPKKGIIYVLKAIEFANKSVSNITLDIVGDGPLKSEIDKFIKEHNLTGIVRLHGQQRHQDVLRMIDNSTIFIQHSITDPDTGNKEGLPVTIIEAAAHGLPVISTFHEGIPEAVEHDKTGFLVKEGDWKLMAEYIIKLAEDGTLRKNMGIAGRNKIINDGFTVDVMIDKLIEFIGLNRLNKTDVNHPTPQKEIKRVLFVNHSIPPYEYSGTPFSTLNHALGMRRKSIEIAVLIPSAGIQDGYDKEVNEDYILYKVPMLDKFFVYFGDIEKVHLNNYISLIKKITDDFHPDIVHINDYVFMPEEIIPMFSKSGAYVIRNVCNLEEVCHLDAPVYFDGKQEVLCGGPDSPKKCAECFLTNVQKKKKDELNSFEVNQYSKKIQRRFDAVRSLYRNDIDGIIFTDKAFRDYFKQFISIPDNVIKINPRGFDFDKYRKTKCKQGRDDIIHIGFFGSLIPRKGIGIALKAFKKIGHMDNFVLDIYGPETVKIYLDTIKELETKYPGKIKFHGKFENSDLPHIADAIDFAILPSNFETFNRLLRELMFFGIPSIVTDFFGASIIENDFNGIKIKVGDDDALADSIKKILLNPFIIEKLSKGAVATRINTLQDEIDGIYDFYKKIIRLKGIKPKMPIQDNTFPETENFKTNQETTDPATIVVEAGRLDKAEQLIREAISHNPDSTRSLHQYGLVKYQQGETSQAITLVEKAMSLDSDNSEITNDLGVLYFQTGSYDKATELFQKAIELDDTQMDARKNLADLHVAAGRFKEAENLYRDILARNPDDSETLTLLQDMAGINPLSANLPADACGALVSATGTQGSLSFNKKSPIFLQCFFADGSSATDTMPLFLTDIRTPGTIELSFNLSREVDITAFRLDLNISIAVVDIHSIILERRFRTPYDLTRCMHTTGTSFGGLVYFFDGRTQPHIAFSPLPVEKLKDATKLKLKLYYSNFGPQAVRDCICEMTRIQESYEKSAKIPRIQKKQIASLEAAMSQPKDITKNFHPHMEKRSLSGHGRRITYIHGLKPLSILPVQQVQPGRIAVHLHLYYTDMAEELLRHIAKMPFAFDLFITVVDQEQSHLVEQKARQICGPQLENLHVIVIPNRGRDIAAFLVALGSCYQQYEYLCHLHSKKSLYAGTVRKDWCDYLFESLFKDEDHLRRIFGLFAINPKLGIVYPTTFKEMPYWCHSWLSNNRSAHELFSRLNISVNTSLYIDYPVGSMLWARSKALEPLFDLNLKFEDFPPEPIPNDGTLCHAIERTFCISGHIRGFTFAELDIREGNFLVGEGKKNLWQYWVRSGDHLVKTLQQYQTISFDVFDTLVTRPLLSPDHAFLLAQHKIEHEMHIKIDFLALRKKAEAIVREKLKPGMDATLDAIYEYFAKISGMPSETVERIRRIEVDNEITLALPRHGMAEIVARLQGEGKKIVYLSDMYLPSDVIREILAHTGIVASKDQILVSSETGIRKDTGAVWRQYRQRIAQYHVGDNEHSDVQLAIDNGIAHYHVMSPNRLCEVGQPRFHLTHRHTLGDSIYAGPVVARLFSSPFSLHETSGHFHINDPMELGYCVFGPVLLYFITWLFKRSQELGIEHLLFLAREGYLLQELFKMYSAHFDDKSIRTSYLLCSRRANSVPTIKRQSDIRTILEAPYEGTLDNLLEARYGIDIDADHMDGSLSSHRLHDETIYLPKEIDAVYKDVLKFKKSILNHAEKEKDAYLAYLKKLGVSKDQKTAIVDIGFAGTIQKYLRKITDLELDGFYFITSPKARKNPLANKLHACFGNFVEFGRGNIIYDYSLILESLLTAPIGQFIRFDESGTPIFGENAYTEETWPVIRAMHLGIIKYFHDVIKWFGDALLAHEPHVDTAVQFFRLISLNPIIISKSLRDTMKVDDFYTSNGMVNAFKYASKIKSHSFSSKPADLEFVNTCLSERPRDDHNHFRSQKEFNNYFNSKHHDYEERLLLEKILSNLSSKSSSLDVKGYCDCCEKNTTMQSSWNFSDATMNHKAYMYNHTAYADWYGKVLLFREHLICEECKLNNRQRGVFYAAKALGLDLSMLDVYSYEQVTQFNTALEKKARTVVGSEFMGDQCRAGELYNGIRHEDALHLSFADNSFDLLISNDVFEHVPDIKQAFREASRILNPGGILLFSIPFDLSINDTVRRAQMIDGQIDHILEPIYHGNPVSNEGSLLFYDFGWDIIDLCKNSGFEDSFMLYYYSPSHMLLGGGLQFVFAGIKSGAAKGKYTTGHSETTKESEIPSKFNDIVQSDSKPVGKPQVSIIIPLYNASALTRACLAAIDEHTAKHTIELILIDNASTDETPQLLQTLPSIVKIIRNKKNLGFARACNQGAMAARGEFLLFLNNDTKVTNGWLDPLLKTIRQPRTGVVGCKLLYPDDRIQHAGISLINGIPDHPYRYEKADHPATCSVTEMDMVTGACFLIPRELFINLRGFDEIYKNGVEDVDLCLRVRQAGYRIIYQPETIIYHHEGQSAGRFNHVKDNLSIFLKRWQNSFDKNGRFNVSTKTRLMPSQKSIVVDSRPCIVWEGSQFVYHSLALVNRELCLRLIEKGYDVSIIPYEKDQFTRKQESMFKHIAKRTNKLLSAPADVHVRHQWPPKFIPPSEGHWVIIQPWEYGSIPREWVSHILASVDEVWVPSNFVRDCYIQSGIPSNRVFVVPNGVDIQMFNPNNPSYKLKTKKKFKFLFVGGTIGRKGIDILLNVYTKNFSIADDVCLVIKDMGGQSFYKGQTAKEIINKIQSEPGAPEIEYFEHTLSSRKLASLYRACDCLVHPYRGEGFGLPIAEAMASGCPVIVTGYGAALDFCPDDITYLSPAKVVNLAEKRIGEMETVDFPWLAEPDKEGLAMLMKYVVAHPEEAAAKGKACAAFIQANFTWDHAVRAVMTRISQLRDKPIVRYSQPMDQVCQPRVDIGVKASILTGNTSNEGNAVISESNLKQERVEKLLGSGEKCFAQGEVKSAVENFKVVLQLDPGNTQALNNLGVIQWQLGNAPSAINIFQKALAFNPNDHDALENLMQAATETGRLDLINPALLDTIKEKQSQHLKFMKLTDIQRKSVNAI